MRLPALSKTEWACLTAAFALLGLGSLAAFEGLRADVTAVTTGREWATSSEARLVDRQSNAPPPVWLPPRAQTAASSADHRIELAPTPDGLTRSTPVSIGIPTPVLTVNNAGAPGSVPVQLLGTGFVFLDPPEAGARAQFWLDLAPLTSGIGPSVGLAFSGKWLDGYRLVGSSPGVVEVRTLPDAGRLLVFPPLPGGTSRLVVQVTATAEVTDAPSVEVEYASGGQIGLAQPRTVAPRPRPGPVSNLRIPRLQLVTAVVPTSWEPPPFVAGQLKSSANITEGNTVLVGHLTGAAACG
jgi:hypothetical protein